MIFMLRGGNFGGKLKFGSRSPRFTNKPLVHPVWHGGSFTVTTSTDLEYWRSTPRVGFRLELSEES